jgi:hypothetical protein
MKGTASPWIDEKRSARIGARRVKLVQDMRAQWKDLDRRIGEFDEGFAAFAKADEDGPPYHRSPASACRLLRL